MLAYCELHHSTVCMLYTAPTALHCTPLSAEIAAEVRMPGGVAGVITCGGLYGVCLCAVHRYALHCGAV